MEIETDIAPTSVTPVPTAAPAPKAPPIAPVRPAKPEAPHGWGVAIRDVLRATRQVLKRESLRASGSAVAEFACALCSSRSGRELFEASIPDARGRDLVQCDECGLVMTWPMPAPEEIPDLYDNGYYGVENAKFGSVTEAFVRVFRFARLRVMRIMKVPVGDVLDLGCGRGVFLQSLEAKGYRAFGTELSDESARSARRRLGDDRVRTGSLQSAGFDDEQFVAITAWQVFEHLHDPADTLDECYRILKPGGALLLGVPNVESWQARWAGSEWFHLDVPRHLYHYGPTTLTQMLAKHGFEVERTSHYNLEQNPFGLLQSFLHRLGRPHMGLYDLLRGPVHPTRRSLFMRTWRYAIYLAVFPFAAAASTLWSLRRSGATFTVLARKV